ncbi:Uncharacterized protein Rs2_13745 [Raphanus sativus]|nr:Uncharacterized protein Rs2_13745 [Raphanus sativus]
MNTYIRMQINTQEEANKKARHRRFAISWVGCIVNSSLRTLSCSLLVKMKDAMLKATDFGLFVFIYRRRKSLQGCSAFYVAPEVSGVQGLFNTSCFVVGQHRTRNKLKKLALKQGYCRESIRRGN